MAPSVNQSIAPTLPAEKSDKALFFRRNFVDLQIHLVISFGGRIDQHRMAKAVRLTYEAEPVLGCRYMEHWWQPYWKRREDLDNLVLCSVKHVAGAGQTIPDYLVQPLDPCRDPLIQVRIFRASNDTLCIKANHVVTDGAGLKEYGRLLGDIYEKLGNDADYYPEVNRNGRRDIGQVTTNFGLIDRMKMFRRGFRNWRTDTFPRRNWQFPAGPGKSPPQKTYILRKLPADQVIALKAYGKKREATLNHIMVAAFYRALHRLIQPSPKTPLRLGTTVDLRRYLASGKGQAICNLSGFMFCNIGTSLGASFEETLTLVKKTFSELKNDCLGLGISRFDLFRWTFFPFFLAHRLVSSFSRLNRLLGPKEIAPWLTNAGVLDAKRLCFGDATIADAFITAPPTNPPFFAIAFTGFLDTMTISIGFSKTSIDSAEVARLLDFVEDEFSRVTPA